MILGIVGGWEFAQVETKLVGRLAKRLRERWASGNWVETVENHRIELAERLIREVFPDPGKAQMILYGQSMGGAAAVRLARQLRPAGYRFRLVALVDSWGRGDERMPDNVASFINYFQRDSFPVRGQRFVLADDPLRTRSMGNREFTYRGKALDMPGESRLRRSWLGSHLKMEYDPALEQDLFERITDAVERWPGEWRYPERLPVFEPPGR